MAGPLRQDLYGARDAGAWRCRVFPAGAVRIPGAALSPARPRRAPAMGSGRAARGGGGAVRAPAPRPLGRVPARARPPRRDPFRRTKDLRWNLAQRRDLKWRRRARPRPFRGRHRDGAGGAASPRRRSVRGRSAGSLVRAGRRCRGMAGEGDSEPGKSFKLLGFLDVKNVPCARDSVLYGSLGSLVMGLGHFLATSRVRRSCDVAVGSYICTMLGYWFYCRYNLAQQRVRQRMLKEGMRNRVLFEGSYLDPEKKQTGGERSNS
uniref:Cytochrome c oxidase assembly protein COX20, mitochondrial n=1 Tax=Cyanoderma ruficeps TaxID=181631 RepID=A0A8C3R1I2_9PASS